MTSNARNHPRWNREFSVAKKCNCWIPEERAPITSVYNIKSIEIIINILKEIELMKFERDRTNEVYKCMYIYIGCKSLSLSWTTTISYFFITHLAFTFTILCKTMSSCQMKQECSYSVACSIAQSCCNWTIQLWICLTIRFLDESTTCWPEGPSNLIVVQQHVRDSILRQFGWKIPNPPKKLEEFQWSTIQINPGQLKISSQIGRTLLKREVNKNIFKTNTIKHYWISKQFKWIKYCWFVFGNYSHHVLCNSSYSFNQKPCEIHRCRPNARMELVQSINRFVAFSGDVFSGYYLTYPCFILVLLAFATNPGIYWHLLQILEFIGICYKQDFTCPMSYYFCWEFCHPRMENYGEFVPCDMCLQSISVDNLTFSKKSTKVSP